MAGTVVGDFTSNLVQEQVALAVAGLPNGTRDQIARVITNVVASAAGGAAGGVSGAAGASSADMFNRQLHPWEYEFADKNAKVVAAHLKITEEEAKGRIVAEILRNSDKDSAESAGARHDWEIRAAVGCSNLNCSGFETDPEYANSQFNMQFVGTYFDSYAGGMGFLQSGLTDLELRQKNLTYERLGKGSMALTACVLSGGTACGAAGGGVATSAGISFITSKPFTTADALMSAYGGLLARQYQEKLLGWALESGGVPQTSIGTSRVGNLILGITKTAPVFAGKQIAVPIGNGTSLGATVDPLFDPVSNRWWGLSNLLDRVGGQ